MSGMEKDKTEKWDSKTIQELNTIEIAVQKFSKIKLYYTKALSDQASSLAPD